LKKEILNVSFSNKECRQGFRLFLTVCEVKDL